MLKRYFFLCAVLFLFLIHGLAHGQSGLRGTVKTKNGDLLPFAAIAVKGTEIGTISNEEGKYQLDLKPGYYEIIFQYLGFKTGVKAFTIENKMESFDVTMEEQALTLAEVRIGSKDEDPAYTIMRRAIAKSRYHFLQVESYTAKAYSKSSFVITDLPLEFMYKKELKEMEKETNFKKGVPILNESVSEVTFTQPNTYKQRVIAARNSQDKSFASANAYFLTSFYQPEVVKAVSPLSPKAFGYYKFEYLGSFRENGIEVNKIKVAPRSYGEGVYRGTIHIIEGEWSIYSLDLETVNTGFNIGIKQVYSPVQNVWMPVNQQFRVKGGIYGLKGHGDLVISQTFSKLKVNPAFQPDIVVLDPKKDKEDAKRVKLSNREIKSGNLEEVVKKQKEFSAKNLRKLMKEYEKKELKTKEEKGEDVDLNFSRNDSTSVDSLASKRSMAFWDSIRTVPLTVAEVKSYTRLDSIIVIQQGTKSQRDSLKVSKSDSLKVGKGSAVGGVIGDILTGHTFSLGKKIPWRLQYVSPLFGLSVNTVEGIVLNGGGFKLKYRMGGAKEKGKEQIDISANGIKRTSTRERNSLSINALTRYSFARQKLMATGGVDYAWKQNVINVTGGQTVSQFNVENPMSPILNSLTTLFLEQNFIKVYQKNFARIDFTTKRDKQHFELKANIEYADRSPLRNVRNTAPYRWIDWGKREFTSNIPFNEELLADETGTISYEMEEHRALTVGISASYKPWQKYKIKKGKTSFYDDDSPKLFADYRRGFRIFGSDVDFDFLQVGITHGFETGIRSKLSYKVAAGAFLNNNAVEFPDFQHFAGNRFFFQYGDPVGTFRMLDYYRFSTAERYLEVHALAELRQFLLTQISWFRIMGIKENFFANYLATPYSDHYGELGYALDIGLRFPLRLEVTNSFEGFKYKHTAFRIGTTMNLNFGK